MVVGRVAPGGGVVKDHAVAVKYLLKIDLLCFDRQLGVQPVQTKGGGHDQAQRREGAAAVSDAGAVSPAGAGVCVAARARRRGPALRTQRSDDSAGGEALRWVSP